MMRLTMVLIKMSIASSLITTATFLYTCAVQYHFRRASTRDFDGLHKEDKPVRSNAQIDKGVHELVHKFVVLDNASVSRRGQVAQCNDLLWSERSRTLSSARKYTSKSCLLCFFIAAETPAGRYVHVASTCQRTDRLGAPSSEGSYKSVVRLSGPIKPSGIESPKLS